MQLLEFGAGEFAAWDSFVAAHPLGWVCHLSTWNRILEQVFPHIHGNILVIQDGGVIRAGMAVYSVKSRLTGNRLVSAPFATLCTPLTRSDGDTNSLLEALLELAESRRSRYVEVRTTQRLSVPAAERLYCCDVFKHHHLRLDGSLESLKQGFDRSCVRQRIGRAQKAGVQTCTVVDEQGIRAFYDLHVKTRKRLGLPPQPYRFIHSLWSLCAPSGLVEIELAKYRDTPIAGILLLRFNARVSAEYLVSDERHRDKSPNQLLVWNAICRAHDQGYRIFDFGRTDVANSSLMDFKRRWGTVESDLPVYYYPPSHFRSMTARRLRLQAPLEWVVRHLPEPGDRWLGSLIYRHMG
jgi:CelD/BcsL family acetyltransferase involved in cellulose biosynthesis